MSSRSFFGIGLVSPMYLGNELLGGHQVASLIVFGADAALLAIAVYGSVVVAVELAAAGAGYLFVWESPFVFRHNFVM